ncbi:MAG TPA: tetratricopeptide repeat protein [Actinomycetes bacterium]|nr:tetratricopeptide repeat protein [Actinomycetes bacterium]
MKQAVSNLGSVLRAQGNLDGARTLHQRALTIRETRLGKDHPATAHSLNNLGSVLANQGDLAGARPCSSAPWPSTRRALAPTIPVPNKAGGILWRWMWHWTIASSRLTLYDVNEHSRVIREVLRHKHLHPKGDAAGILNWLQRTNSVLGRHWAVTGGWG